MTQGVAPPPLEVRGLTVRYGGLCALDDVSLRVDHAQIAGLIGPNGAGKTTLFDRVTGVVKPTEGQILLFGQDVTSWPADRRIRAGMGRTFQRLELFSSLTVEENLLVAVEARSTKGSLTDDLLRLRDSITGRRMAERRAHRILEAVGLAEHRNTRAGDLPIGLSRLAELARALCTNPRLLLLDEPSAGLNSEESTRLAHVLLRLRDKGRRSLLVVEHDMRFLLGLSDHVYVLDFGKLIASGPPDAVRRDAAVQAAYLGKETAGGATRG